MIQKEMNLVHNPHPKHNRLLWTFFVNPHPVGVYESTPPVDWGVDYTHLVVDRFFASPPTLWTGKPFNFVALRAQSIGHPLPPTVNPHSSRQNPWSMAS